VVRTSFASTTIRGPNASVTNSPAGTIRTAEFFGLRDGKIASIRLVFDATALRQLMSG
jgi:hypothetical protein